MLDSADDAPTSRDPRLLWTAPADGSYRLTVRDLAGAGRGGPQFYYRLSVAPLEPELRLTAAQPTALVRPGAKVELTVSVFQAFQPGAVTVRVEGLPKGVTAEPVSVKPSPDRAQTMQAKLVLTAAADAAPGFAPVRVIAAAGGASPLEAEARWMMTGDGGWGYGTGSTGMLVVLVTPP